MSVTIPWIPLTAAALSFFTVIVITPWAIRYLRKIGLMVRDVHKSDQPLIPASGGIAVIAGMIVGISFFIFYRTFFPDSGQLAVDSETLKLLFVGLTTILLITFIGFLDDLLIKHDKSESSGLRQWQKPILTLVAAIPLIVVKAGADTMVFPFIGRINFGILYPLLLVPIGVTGSANMINMLAGFNGLETGLGLITTGMLSVYAYAHDRYLAALIGVIAFAALAGFFRYARYPSKIFPGDSLTYLIGAILATIAILGDIERAAIIMSIPFFVEFLLKLRGKFQKKSLGQLVNGQLTSRYPKIYSLTHLFLRRNFTERQLVYSIWAIEGVFALLIWVV